MAQIFEFYNETIYSGAPELREYFLFKSEVPVLAIIFSYFIFVTFVGPSIMQNRKPIKLPRFMFVYNFALVLNYVFILTQSYVNLSQFGANFFCKFYEDEKVKYLFAKNINLFMNLFAIKLVELLDTVFMVLSKKTQNITKLHVLHHCLVPIFGWLLYRSETGSYLVVFMLFNSIVHVIMYTYYGIAGLGPRYQKYIWWKKYLTTLQIVQFLFIIFYLPAAYIMGCTTSNFVFICSIIITVLFLFLFINYYRSAFKSKRKASAVQNGAKKKLY